MLLISFHGEITKNIILLNKDLLKEEMIISPWKLQITTDHLCHDNAYDIYLYKLFN